MASFEVKEAMLLSESITRHPASRLSLRGEAPLGIPWHPCQGRASAGFPPFVASSLRRFVASSLRLLVRPAPRARELLGQIAHHGLGVAEEHERLVREVQLVVDAREAGVLAALDGVDRL